MLCNTTDVRTLQKKTDRSEQAIRRSPEHCAVRTQICRRDLIKDIYVCVCVPLYNVHLVGILKILVL